MHMSLSTFTLISLVVGGSLWNVNKGANYQYGKDTNTKKLQQGNISLPDSINLRA